MNNKLKTSIGLILGSLAMTSTVNAFELSQHENNILFDLLNHNNNSLTVVLPNNERYEFKFNSDSFELSALDLGLKSFEEGQYKYEITPVIKSGKLSQDVRKLDNPEVTKEFKNNFKNSKETLTGVFSIKNNKLADDFDENPNRDQVILDDLIVDGSACIGFDCVDGESFGFDTLRLKENNLRIKFDDTSIAASFPANDWQLTANDSANGGQNKFSIDDVTGGRTPFTVEAGAPSHSLYVDDGGRIGIRTSTPSTEIHAVDGDTPTLRLQQDGSSGFAPQTWDVAGNETNFFIRDVTNGSTLPFRIRPGAPTSAIDVTASGNVGIGDTSADASLNIERSDGTAQLLIEETNASAAARELIKLSNNGGSYITFENTANSNKSWYFTHENSAGTSFNITHDDSAGAAMRLTTGGDMSITGTLTTATTTYPDYVFEKDYKLMPLNDVKTFIEDNGHLPNVPSAEEMIANGINLTDMHVKLMEKVEELTLYSLQQHEDINSLKRQIELLDRN